MDLTGHWVGIAAVVTFVVAYLAVLVEEFTHLRKSIPMILASGIIWAIIAFQYASVGKPHEVEEAVRAFLVQFAELFLFLLSAMTYVNSMTERLIFDALRSWLVRQRFGYRSLFWITGVLSFFLSALLDNLTTALLICAVIMAVGRDNARFVGLGCINTVVAANAGGAFSPFGDITTLMVWQRGVLEFHTFFYLFLPAAVNFVVPAAFMHFAIHPGVPDASERPVSMKRGAVPIMGLFAATVTTAVAFHQFLDLPPFLGMITGLGFLKVYGYYLRVTHDRTSGPDGTTGEIEAFDSFREVARAEWDTLLFFFGVIMCVGGLGFVGYLDHLSRFMYLQLGPTMANTMVGLLSAIVDNIPVMVAVLQMRPDMDVLQWLLVTLTTGVGGSLFSVGSAAGVALMGQTRGIYTFFRHLRWTPAIALGYAMSIWVHMMLNASMEGRPPG